jgi:hypothetical protein
LRWQRIVLPSFLALPMLAVMLGLGIWQVQRMGWKSALLQELAAAQAGPPVSADNPAPFAHIMASGRFRHDLELLLGSEVRGTTLGAALITPLTLDLPLLALNLLYHRRTGIPYDVPSLLLLGMAAFSLGVQQPWRLLRLFRQWRRQQAARRKADAAASPAVGEGESTDWDELSLQEIQAAQRQAGVEGGFKLSPSKERQRSNAAAQATMKALEAKMRAASPEPYADEERGTPNAYNA